ncbi:MAG: YIP1 family protein [Syntrophobacterales bacterium]|nr:YIP1 family protein [Syntrophobacterales bacterium]
MESTNLYFNRIIRAAKLDANLYEEVEADKGALGQAAGVVVLSSIAAGIGAATTAGFNGILLGTLMALIGWCVWAYIAYLVGTKILPEPQTRADYGELLRTIGFSSSPGLIRVLGIIPGLLWAVSMIASIWMMAAMVIAIRQALDYKSTFRAVGVCIIGWIIQLLFIILLFAIFGSPGQPA